MKKILLILLVAVLAMSLFAGCGGSGSETTAPETTQPPPETPEATQEAALTPEARTLAPAELFGDALNAFSDVLFPEGYSVYAAGFQNGGEYSFYDLYLTAEGDPEEIITYMSNLVGDGAEESIQQNIDYYHNSGFVCIHGTQVEDGLNADCEIAPTQEDAYDYDYVEGCTMLLRAPIDDASGYDQIIADNYNLNSLSEVAEYLDLMPITGHSEIYVRKNRNNVQIDAVYNPVENVAEIMESMKASVAYKGFDESVNILHLEDYGEVGNSVLFDVGENSICIFQNLGDAEKNYGDYEIVTSALTDLGFTDYIESDALCEYKDEDNDLMITINVPEWGSRPDEWENSCVLFLNNINGYLLAVWYYPEEGVYTFQADKEDVFGKYEYFANTNEFDGEYPDPDTVQEVFIDLYGLAEEAPVREDVYMEGVDLFRNYINDQFGMSPEALYELASVT